MQGRGISAWTAADRHEIEFGALSRHRTTPLTDHLGPGQLGSRRSSCRHIRSLSSLARDAERAQRHGVFRTVAPPVPPAPRPGLRSLPTTTTLEEDLDQLADPAAVAFGGDPIALMRSRLVNDLLHVMDDRQWIKIEGLIVHDGNDPRDDGTHIVSGVSSYVRHDQHCQHGATNRFRPPQPSCVGDPWPGTAWWLWNRNRVMRGRPV